MKGEKREERMEERGRKGNGQRQDDKNRPIKRKSLYKMLMR